MITDGVGTSGDDAEMMERERIAWAIFDALDADWADERFPYAPQVVAFGLTEVHLDGTVDLLRVGSAILSADFGDVAHVRAERDAANAKLRQASRDLREAQQLLNLIAKRVGVVSISNSELIGYECGDSYSVESVTGGLRVAPKPASA